MKNVDLKKLSNYLPVFTKKKIYGVHLDSIIYVESGSRRIFVTTEEEGVGAHVFYNRLQTVKYALPEHFIQCHRSFVVNLKKVIMLQERCFFMKDGTRVPISASYYTDAKVEYKKFLMS